MRIDGSWLICDDGVLRPIIVADAKRSDGTWLEIRMLVDTGADRTVLSADILESLKIPGDQPKENLAGVGGTVSSVIISTQLRMIGRTNQSMLLDGNITAFTDAAALDMSVLGRDVTNLFALIVDRPKDIICMLGPKHRYEIVED